MSLFCADWGVKILMKSALFEPKILKFEKNAVFGTRLHFLVQEKIGSNDRPDQFLHINSRLTLFANFTSHFSRL
jgi:hypothetical protein